MTNPQKRKGSQFERDVVAYLHHWFPHIERAYGAGRPDDVGDLDGTPGIVWELKNHKAFHLAAWSAETELEQKNANAEFGILVVKRPGHGPAHAYAILPLEQMAQLLKEAGR